MSKNPASDWLVTVSGDRLLQRPTPPAAAKKDDGEPMTYCDGTPMHYADNTPMHFAKRVADK